MKIENRSIQYNMGEIREAAEWLLTESAGERIWLFDAPMGGGKTTLIKVLCELLDVDEVASSPTFAIVNEYHTKGGDVVYHIDAYRLEAEVDGANIGVGEYMDSGAYCFIEWPKVLGSLLPEEALRIRLDQVDEATRKVTILDSDTPFVYDVR